MSRLRDLRKRWLRPVASGVLLFGLLGGPAPGAVGSCGGDGLDEPADLPSYCRKRGELTCVRRHLRKEITIDESNTCRRSAIAECENRFWLPECEPTERQARACVNALESFDTLQTKESELSECSVAMLCGISVPPSTDREGTGAKPAQSPGQALDGGADDDEDGR